jgi:hypothetical protein
MGIRCGAVLFSDEELLFRSWWDGSEWRTSPRLAPEMVPLWTASRVASGLDVVVPGAQPSGSLLLSCESRELEEGPLLFAPIVGGNPVSTLAVAAALLDDSSAEQFESHLRRSNSAIGLVPVVGVCVVAGVVASPLCVWKTKVCCSEVRVAGGAVEAAAAAASWSNSSSAPRPLLRRCSAWYSSRSTASLTPSNTARLLEGSFRPPMGELGVGDERSEPLAVRGGRWGEVGMRASSDDAPPPIEETAGRRLPPPSRRFERVIAVDADGDAVGV